MKACRPKPPELPTTERLARALAAARQACRCRDAVPALEGMATRDGRAHP